MISTIITAGGSSSRFKGINKLLYEINGIPVIKITADKFLSIPEISEIIISCNGNILKQVSEIFKNTDKVKIVEGGQTRQESVYNGLIACNNCEYVIIHDGARPFITQNTIINCINNAKKYGASIVAVKTVDTIKIADSDGFITSTPDRNFLWNAQTPQIFEYSKILEAHNKLRNNNYTDDSLLFEILNIPVYITEGEYSNFKITTASDLEKINDKL